MSSGVNNNKKYRYVSRGLDDSFLLHTPRPSWTNTISGIAGFAVDKSKCTYNLELLGLFSDVVKRVDKSNYIFYVEILGLC